MLTKQLHIDKEAVATLSLLEEGLLYPVTKLMNEKEAYEVDQTKKYQGVSYPFSFMLAPSGDKNEKVLLSAKKGERLDLVCDGKVCGYIITDEVYHVNKDERIKTIYGTNNPEHQGVRDTYKRLGSYSICGDFHVEFEDIKKHKQMVKEAIEQTGAKRISSMMISGKPFHRVHERLIRTALVKTDLMVIFILKPYINDFLSYETRYNCVQYFCNNYLPKSKVVLIPLENTYIFGGFNELILNALVAKNFGCTNLVIGKNHAGLGAFYTSTVEFSTILDSIEGIDINIDILSEFVYCNQCNTLVSTNTCPHGLHHHIRYHSQSILDLLELGIIPPAILMRKEISSIILSDLFPEKTEILNKIHQHLCPSSGLIDDFKTHDFYESLMDLYQTSSLT
jgi:sulfate adenylyltransferase